MPSRVKAGACVKHYRPRYTCTELGSVVHTAQCSAELSWLCPALSCAVLRVFEMWI